MPVDAEAVKILPVTASVIIYSQIARRKMLIFVRTKGGIMKLAVIFGGMSTEHDVSVVSGTSVLKNLDKDKYEILPLYIDKSGNWFKYTKNIEDIEIAKIGEKLNSLEKVDNVIELLKEQDVAFPVLHGLYR